LNFPLFALPSVFQFAMRYPQVLASEPSRQNTMDIVLKPERLQPDRVEPERQLGHIALAMTI
jgi:hypothetical protein